MKSEWLERFQFSRPVGQCGQNVYYLATEKATSAPVILRTVIHHLGMGIDYGAIFEDEERTFRRLHEAGLLTYFESDFSDERNMMAFKIEDACEWVCTHLSKPAIMRALQTETN